MNEIEARLFCHGETRTPVGHLAQTFGQHRLTNDRMLIERIAFLVEQLGFVLEVSFAIAILLLIRSIDGEEIMKCSRSRTTDTSEAIGIVRLALGGGGPRQVRIILSTEFVPFVQRTIGEQTNFLRREQRRQDEFHQPT